VNRDIASNRFVVEGQVQAKPVETPYFTDNSQLAVELLSDTLNKQVLLVNEALTQGKILFSQPTDSMLKPMMHRSDNFFAEQSLMMVSQKLLGEMNDANIISRLLQTDLKDLPQKPHWVDGSGLSRYNLFTPQDMVTILNKMQTEFGIERMKAILPTGNEGTLTNYYKNETGYVFAKTGTLSGVVAFSGFLFTKKNKLLIVSVLVNNHQASATAVRRAVEKFVEQLREKN
jgi:D-alanyl-D-alanine carboxypeptidase/D-alanyl-D-alanine-endopeptidase (penicillin-binding protein 4)